MAAAQCIVNNPETQLAAAVVTQAITDAMDGDHTAVYFLTHTLWEPDCLWADCLADMLDRPKFERMLKRLNIPLQTS